MQNKVFLYLILPPPYGGGEIRNYYLSNYFEKNNRYYIFNGTNKKNNKLRQGKINIYNIYFGISIIFRIIIDLLKVRPNVMYLSIPKTFVLFIRTTIIISIAHTLGIKIVGDLAGMDFYFLNEGILKRAIGLHILRKVTIIRLLGNSIQSRMQNNYNLKNTIVFDNGAYIPIEKVNRHKNFDGSINLLYCGALTKEKGIKLILESIPLIIKFKENVKFTFLGEWADLSLKEWANRFIEKERISEFVNFPGLVVNEKKWEYFNNAHIYIQLSYFEGQPISVLEAIGFGLPIVASTVGAIPDTVVNNRNGILVPTLSIENVLVAIKCLVNNPKQCYQISLNNFEDYNRRFRLQSYLANVEKLLNCI